jgi:hypothetical protein
MRERDRATQVQEVLRLQTDKIRKEPLQGIILVKILDIQNKERILKPTRENHQITCKGQTQQNSFRFLTRNSRRNRSME